MHNHISSTSVNRRRFLANAGMGLGTTALASLVLGPKLASAAAPSAASGAPSDIPTGCHFAPKAKRVIFLFMAGAPSQIDLFDYKPELVKQFNQPLPPSVSQGQRVTAMTRGKEQLIVPSRFGFSQQGESGMWMSDLLPHLSTQVDKLCFIDSMHTESINHDPGKTAFCTGTELPGKPSMGAIRRRMLDSLGDLNRKHFGEIGDPEIETTIAQQEMAFRMQTSVPELTDISDESPETLAMYGEEVNTPGSYARNCLLARRMAQRDVRFIQLFHRGWDHHSKLPANLPGQCQDVDQPTTALLKDLEQRGLLEDTLVVFAGEFGRTVYGQGKLDMDSYGRDHHPRCFTALLAGGGVKGGIRHGATDEFSYNVVADPVHVRDLHATMLHLLGVDHKRLTFPFQGLEQKLTGVEPARVVKEIIA